MFLTRAAVAALMNRQGIGTSEHDRKTRGTRVRNDMDTHITTCHDTGPIDTFFFYFIIYLFKYNYLLNTNK